ncbi:MAG: aminotransferase class I/II-fold pyridoxal phosphate-dependent enzyme [Spirochaetaceae bacterium]
MNSLAEKLNKSLEPTVVGRLLSETGRRLFFPKGIVAQSAEAKSRAHRFNATAGMAYKEGVPLILPSAAALTHHFHPSESVAYAPTPGVAELRKRWKEEMIAKNPSLRGKTTSTPMVTSGLTNGIVHVAELFVNTGDPVVMPDMFWGNYRLIFEHRKEARIETFPFFSEEGGFNLEGFSVSLEAAAAERRKVVLLLNFPNNPTGYSPSTAEVRGIVERLTKLADSGVDILVISDDAYFGLFFEPELAEESIFASLVDAHERILAIKIDGATKEDFAWGLRVGFLTFGNAGLGREAIDALEQKFVGSLRAIVSNTSNLSQHLLLKVMNDPSYYEQKEKAREVLRERYGIIKRWLAEKAPLHHASPLEPLPFNSGYFMSFRCRGIDAEELRLLLLDRGIGTISIDGSYLRVAFASVDADSLPELYDEIYAAAEELAQP